METTTMPRLKPSTVETIRDQLEFQRSRQPSWLAYHFPSVADRGTPVEYADVEAITPREADSVRHLLASQIRHGRKRVWQRKARSVSLLGETQDSGDDEWSVRLIQLEEALRDLCAVYGLPYPL